MEIIAAAGFRWYLDQFSGIVGPAHPVGSPFYNVEGARREEEGVYRIFFSVDTPRLQLHKYLWLVQSVWEFQFIHEIEWVKPRECVVRFTRVNNGNPVDPLEWNLLIGKRNGDMAEPFGLVLLQSFYPNGTLAPIDNHPLKEFGARGVSQPCTTLFPGAFLLKTDVDISTGGSAWYLWADEPGMSAVRYSSDLRQIRVDIGNVASGISPLPTTDIWHLAVFNYSDAKPSSIGPIDLPPMVAGDFQLAILHADFPLGNPIPNTNYVAGDVGLLNNPNAGASKLFKLRSSNPAILSVPDPTNGLVFGIAPGQATLTAEFRGLTYTSPPITVTAP